MAKFGMSAANCTEYPALQPNPDISGVGILWAFLLTSYITLLCCVTKTGLEHWWPPSKHPKIERWTTALGVSIMSFSDQQVVTGISIIIGGLSQLQAGISVYHWQSVVNLAWLATITHLVTLTALRAEIKKNTALKILRTSGMGILIVMLICVMGPIGYLVSESGDVPHEFPAWCLYQSDIEWKFRPGIEEGLDGTLITKEYNWLYQFIAMGVLIYSFLTRLILLLTTRSSICGFVLRLPAVGPHQPWKAMEKPLNSLQSPTLPGGNAAGNGPNAPVKIHLKIHKIFTTYWLKICYSIYALAVAGNEMYKSKLWEFTWLIVALIWGTLRLLLARSGLMEFDQDPSEIPANSILPKEVVIQHELWGFGQIVALVLLAIPLASFFGTYFGDQPCSTPKIISAVTTSTASASTTDIRQMLYRNPWYRKLWWLWYSFSVAIGGDLLYFFPAGSTGYFLSSGAFIRNNFLQYFLWALVDIALLWTSTLIFLDQDLQNVWRSWAISECVSKEPFATMCWTILLVLLIGISVIFDVSVYMQGSAGFPDMEIFWR